MSKKVKMQGRAGLLAAAFLILTVVPAFAAPNANKLCGLIRESKAYQQYRLRPVSDFSKLIYLIDRFATCNIEIIYDGYYFKAPFAARIARWFLATHYKKQTTREWIMRWCNMTVPQGRPIYAKFPNGAFRLAREVLIDEIDDLDKVVKEDESAIPSEMELTPLAQLVVQSPAPDRLSPPSR